MRTGRDLFNRGPAFDMLAAGAELRAQRPFGWEAFARAPRRAAAGCLRARVYVVCGVTVAIERSMLFWCGSCGVWWRVGRERLLRAQVSTWHGCTV